MARGSVLTVASGKGGTMKTGLVTVLGVVLATRGYRIAVVDADPNQSFVRWFKTAYEGPKLTCTTEISHEEIVHHALAQAEEHDVVLIDTAGFGNQTAGMAIGVADVVLIPCMPDRSSIAEAVKTARQASSFAKVRGRDIPARVVRTRWNPKGLAERAAVQDLEQERLSLLNQHMSVSADVAKISFTGVVPTTCRTATEADIIIAELIALRVVPSKPMSRKAAA
jgi:chromosome partitioning protein